MISFPTKTVWQRAIERLVVVCVAAGVTDLLNNAPTGWVVKGGVVYFALKTLVDILNKDVPSY